MDDKYIASTIGSFRDPFIQEHLQGNVARSVSYDLPVPVAQSIQTIIEQALRGLSARQGLSHEAVISSDTFIFPDIHGRLDLAVQNLFAANIVDEQGNWKARNKTCIVLGDMISRGPYSTETILYLLALKQQAAEKDSTFILLIGNHEHCLINDASVGFYNIIDREPLKKILLESIARDQIKASYAENGRNIICIHAGLEKDILKLAISGIDPSTTELLFTGGKVPSEDIYRLMKQRGIGIEAVSDWLNEKFKKDLTWNAPILTNKPLTSTGKGILNTRKKAHRPDEYKIEEGKTYKATQFLGHTTTNYHAFLQKATSYGAFKKINHNFYLDYDLIRGNRAFAMICGDEIYQVHSNENGLMPIDPSSEQYSKVPDFMHATRGCFHGNTKPLDLTRWEVKRIGRLPNVAKEKNHATPLRRRRKVSLMRRSITMVNLIPGVLRRGPSYGER